MRQALHIFKKDVRYLRYEIALVLLIAGVFAAMHARASHGLSDSWWAQLALVVASAFLIGRLVLAEAIPGDRQFWITRPYRWRSLLGAKLLFIVVFVNLPLALAHLFILAVEGFPLVSNLAGLFWTQFLLFTLVSLPFAALAALNSGIVPFIFSQLIVLAAVFSVQELLPPLPRWLDGVEWVPASLALFFLGATAVTVLLVQYKSRRILFSRWYALGGIAAAVLVFAAMPWPVALAVQSHLSRQPSLGSSITIAAGEISGQPNGLPYLVARAKPGALYLPILMQGIPNGTEIQADAVTASLEAPDGHKARVSATDCPDLRRLTTSVNSAMISTTCFPDPVFLSRERDRPLTLHASLYFTLFGNARAKTIPLTGVPSDALDGLQCYTDVVKAEWDVYCRSAFRWPARLVYAKLGHTNANSFAQVVSYSPFPGGLNIDPVETRWASAYAAGPAPEVRDVTILVEEPLTHLRRDIDVRDVRLSPVRFRLGVPPQKSTTP
jgi:hypothetical protein